MSYFDDIELEVKRGMEGLNVGIPFGSGIEAITDYLHGVIKGRFYLLGGNTGTGKTALADQMFVLGPLEFIEHHPEFPMKLEIDYYTLEIKTTAKLTKWACWKLLKEKNILLDVDTIMSRSYKHRLSQETFELFMSAREWTDKLQESIVFREHGSPSSINNNTINYFKTKGNDVSEIVERDGIKIKETKYVPKDPNLVHLTIADHIGLMARDSQSTDKKSNLDLFSLNTVKTRNYYGDSTLAISQFNRDLGDVTRKRFSELTPQLEDFKDTGNTQEDSDVTLALFEPKRYNLSDYKGYNLAKLANWYRHFFVIKNRWGSAGGHKAMQFLGECGAFEEFPKSEFFKTNPELDTEIQTKILNVPRPK